MLLIFSAIRQAGKKHVRSSHNHHRHQEHSVSLGGECKIQLEHAHWIKVQVGKPLLVRKLFQNLFPIFLYC